MSTYTEQQREEAIEEMMGQRRYVEEFLFGGPDIEALVLLLLSRGLPLNTRDQRDDRLIDAYDERLTALKAEFATYANQRITDGRGGSASRVDRYLDFHEANRLEDAA